MRWVPIVSKSINNTIVLIAGYLYGPEKKKLMATFTEISTIDGCNYTSNL